MENLKRWLTRAEELCHAGNVSVASVTSRPNLSKVEPQIMFVVLWVTCQPVILSSFILCALFCLLTYAKNNFMLHFIISVKEINPADTCVTDETADPVDRWMSWCRGWWCRLPCAGCCVEAGSHPFSVERLPSVSEDLLAAVFLRAPEWSFPAPSLTSPLRSPLTSR